MPMMTKDGDPTLTELANWIAELRSFVRGHQAFWCLACYEVKCTSDCPLESFVQKHAEFCK